MTRQINKKFVYLALLIGTAIILIASYNLLDTLFPSLPLAAGQLTNFIRSSSGFDNLPDSLTGEDITKHRAGDGNFDAVFVTAPAKINSGLGPLFNNNSCAGCHIKDGRGLVEKGQLLIRVSSSNNKEFAESLTALAKYHREAASGLENTPPFPGLGNQIQDSAVYGMTPEAIVAINWQEEKGKYGDGKEYSLRSPLVKITTPEGQILDRDIQISPRLPQPVFGLGLLEAIDESTLRNLEDIDDRDRDGISGKINRVWDAKAKKVAIGRFGWKASHPSLEQQIAAAYVNDMGITNPLFPEGNGTTDIDPQTLEENTFYVQTLGAPVRSFWNDSKVKQGEKLFNDAQCASCHLTEMKTGNSQIKVVANQTIHPYTDLLLHDLGKGLADNRPDFLASGTEWRTQSLWGLGLTKTVLPDATYLHDGRARTLEEAILWHGGEAEVAKENFRTMSADDRDRLIKFLNSL
jgi:CxxC motif-containing protein (DUF1111 family)